MIIRGHEIDVDVEEELEPYLDQLDKHRIRGNKLQACSPFRSEAHPSFAVNLDNGTFIDSGSDTEHWRKGNLVKLLAYLSDSLYEEVENELLEKYLTILDDMDEFSLDVQLQQEEGPTFVPEDVLKQYAFRHPYLGGRGISEKTQRAFQIGYDRKSKSVVFVWHDKNGRPVNLKFRNVHKKVFRYMKGGQSIKKHVYGLHFVHRLKSKRVVIVEAETDALYLWSNGFPAIALGSASMSSEQKFAILSSPIEEIVLGFDVDNAGKRVSENVRDRFIGKVDLYEMSIPKGCKDINDIPQKDLGNVVGNVTKVIPQFLTLA